MRTPTDATAAAAETMDYLLAYVYGTTNNTSDVSFYFVGDILTFWWQNTTQNISYIFIALHSNYTA